jgi:hypothetical protein
MVIQAVIATNSETDKLDLERIINATNKSNPKPADLEALKKILDENPKVWQSAGNLTIGMQKGIVSKHFSNSAFVQESIERYLLELRNQLGWKDATELEKILIRQVCLCWLNLHITEARKLETTSGNHSMREGIYWEKALIAAQKRYLKAVETLGKMQKIVAQTKEIQARADNAKASQALKAARLLNNLNSNEPLQINVN